jgi:hypothetical protein
MSLDERLPDLLSGASTGADQAPPTRAGVQTAIGRRAERRRRQRVAVSTIALLVVVAGVIGGLALAPGDDDQTPDVPVQPGNEVPILGIERAGWTLVDTRVETDEDDPTPTVFDAVTFRMTSGDLLPYLQVVVSPAQGDPYTAGRRPLALDRGIEGHHGELDDSSSVTWEADGQYVGVIGNNVPDETVVAYAHDLSGGTVDTTTLDAPEGFPTAERYRLPQASAVLGYAEYRGPDETTVEVEVTGMTGWIDFVLQPDPRGFRSDNTIEVADNPVGPGTAIIRELAGSDEGPSADAYWRTPDGFSVHVGADGAQAHEIVRDLVENGGFVVLDDATAEDPVTTTTAAATVTTVPATTSTTTIVSNVLDGVPVFDREHLGSGTSIAITFGDQAVELASPLDDTTETPPYCPHPNGRTFDRYFIVDVAFAASEVGGIVYDDPDLALWWCAEAEATFVAIGHSAAVVPDARSQGPTVVVDLPG